MKHTLRTRWRWQRAHTESIVVIEAVFQAAMFALNAFAYWNACEPSHHTLSKSPSPHEPRAPTVSPVHWGPQRPAGLKSAERSVCPRRFRCGTTAAVDDGKSERASMLSLCAHTMLEE
jgi:hypothetical protein